MNGSGEGVMKYRYATIEVKVPDLTPDIEPNDKLRLLIGDRVEYQVFSWTVEYGSAGDDQEFDLGGEG